MNAFAFALTMLKNFQPTNSVIAGGAVSLLVYTIGLGLVTAGVALPIIGIPTMAMVGAASAITGHLVTSLVPDSVTQQINSLAAKFNVSAQDLRAAMPDVQYKYPGDNNKSPTPNNLNKG